MDSDQRPLSYYTVLGIDTNSSIAEIRRAYRKLAMQWHPDRRTRTPSLLGEAKRKFQQIQEAYSVLSDQTKRTMYDAGLYDPNDEEEEDKGFYDFVQEMVSLMASVKREEKSYSMEELQRMFMEMAQGFDSPQWFCGFGNEGTSYGSTVLEDSRSCKRGRWQSDQTMGRDSGLPCPPVRFGEFGRTGFCG